MSQVESLALAVLATLAAVALVGVMATIALIWASRDTHHTPTGDPVDQAADDWQDVLAETPKTGRRS